MSIQLGPETEARLRQEAAERGLPVDEYISLALAGYRRSGNSTSAEIRSADSINRTAEMAWILHPSPEFVGKWVALAGNRVVSSGPTAKAVFDEAKLQGIEVPFVVYVSPHRDEPFAGGWLD